MVRFSKQVNDESGVVPPIAYGLCPAKTFTRDTGEVIAGRSVYNHCQIVGETANELIARLPQTIRLALFPEGSALAAASHDIGKVSPYFIEKIRRNCTNGITGIPPNLAIDPETERQWGGHAGVSQVTAQKLKAPRYVPEILGQHHGFSPAVKGLRFDDEIFGGTTWHQERQALVSELKAHFSTDWPSVESIPQARVLAGLTSVADWVGSGEFFENPDAAWEGNIGRALDSAGFIPPTYRSGQSFQQVFGFETRPAQQALIDQVQSPGVYLLEAPMGMGKTEAALYAGYRMLERGQATGIYFALPTQLTSNKIYERFNTFLQEVLSEDCAHRSLLLHGNAWLLEHTDMGEEGRPGGAWFSHAKRGLLAPFAVGTIDQALMAAMNVKHGFVRAFGLAGKVVILDEVHTYDAYTGTLLDALVELLRSLHCTVIILTATLNRDRRQQLLGCTPSHDDYPLITAAPQDGTFTEIPVPAPQGQRVAIQLVSDEQDAVEEALDRAVEGQQVLWIENTVNEAQQRYLDLAARALELGVTCGLLHSRFTADHRQCIEDKWVTLFGRTGWKDRQQSGRILIGTQVLEQSLDIDSDFLISRFAPTDMLLQRMGRLWRHADTPRPPSAVCEAWLLAPSLHQAVENPSQGFGASAFVYSPYVMCRSLEVWHQLSSVQLPGDIRPLIEQTYAQRPETGPMATWLHDLDNGTRWRKGRKALRQLARVTLAEAGNTLPERKAETRYSDTETCEVLLLRGLDHSHDRKESQLTLLNGESIQLPSNRYSLGKPAWRKLSATLMRQVVSVRVHDAPCPMPITTLEKFGLQNCFYLGNPEHDEAMLRVAIVDEMGSIAGLQGFRAHEKHRLNYRFDLGYRLIKE